VQANIAEQKIMLKKPGVSDPQSWHAQAYQAYLWGGHS